MLKFIATVLTLTSISCFAQPKLDIIENDYKKYTTLIAESQIGANLLLDKLNPNAECYLSLEKPSGYQALKGNNFKFSEAKLINKIIFCFDDEKGLISSTDSVFMRVLNHTYIAFHNAKPSNAEVTETMQLDYDNYKIKYTKSILVTNKNSSYYLINGTAVFMSDIIKITR